MADVYLQPVAAGSDVLLVDPTLATAPTTVRVYAEFPAAYAIDGSTLPVAVSIEVTPQGATVRSGGTLQFYAQVLGENNPQQGVTWEVTPGTVDASGVVTTPAGIAEDQIGSVTARSELDPNISETAAFLILGVGAPPIVRGVQISPVTAFIEGGGAFQFYAEVFGDNAPSQDVTWETNLGSVDSSGLLAAPGATLAVQQGTLTATSSEDTDISASINFNVLPLMEAFTPSAARTVRILPGRSAFAVGSHWALGSAGPVGAKDPNSTIDIPFDWSAWLADIGGAQLAKVEFFLSGNLQEEGAIPSATGGTVLVSGGTPKGTATITCRITTATTPSRTDDRTVVLQIGDQ